MQKTRALATDAGDRADFKYWASSGTVNTTPPNDAAFLEYKDEYITKYFDGMSKAATIPAGVKPVGTQMFESSTRRKPLFNQCTNVKLHGFMYPYLLVQQAYTSSTMAYYKTYWRDGIPVTNFNTLATGVPSWAAAEGSRRRAYWSMQPRFEGEVQLLNFIYELKDFKELMHLCGKTPHGYAQSCTRLGKAMKRVTKNYEFLKSTFQTAKGASKLWANLRLANEFALKPLIKDVRAITDQLMITAQAAQAEFAERGLEAQDSHFGENLDESYVGSWGTGNYQMRFTGLYSITKFNATMQYKYDTKLREGKDLFQRYWGLEGTYGVMWEAIPFSFLADYFVKIGNSLHYMETDPNVHMTMLQYCESLLQRNCNCVGWNPSHGLVHRFYCPSSRRPETSGAFCPTSGIEWTWYNRRITTPNCGAALPAIKCPSQGQQMNMLALVRGMLG